MSLRLTRFGDHTRSFPFFRDLRTYTKADLSKDALAGLTVGVILVPQGMAYATLAGLPAVYGLYASLVPTLLYPVFGTSRKLSVGPVAMSSLLVLAGVGAFAEPGSSRFIAYAITTALVVGFVQIIFGILKLGFLVNFLSHPVIKGFTSAAAIIIIGSQIGSLLGIPLPHSNHIDEIIVAALGHIHLTNLPTLLMGVGSVALIAVLQQIRKPLPVALIAMVVCTLIVAIFRLQDYGIAVVGNVPRGLPSFGLPGLSWFEFRALMPLAFLLTFVSMIESIAIGKAIEEKGRTYRLDPNKELVALGISKVAGSMFQAYPTTGSFSRSAINVKSGARSGISSVFAVVLVVLTLLLLTPLFQFLPVVALSAIVVTAVTGLIDFRTARALWHKHRSDFFMMLATFIITIFFGIIQGVLSGIMLSLAIVIYRTTKPHMTVLGRIPETNSYRNVSRFPQSQRLESVLIVRFDSSLYFGNANIFRESMERMMDEKGGSLKYFILDASGIFDIDSSGMLALEEILDNAQSRGVRFILVSAIGPLRDILYRAGLMERIGEENQFLDVHHAMQHLDGETKPTSLAAVQTNI